MNCPRCGRDLNPQTGICSNCGFSNFDNMNNQMNNQINTQKKKMNFGFRVPTRNARSYAAIFTAILFCPALMSVVIDKVFFHNIGWSGYVIGALAVLWCFFVLPVLKCFPTVLTVLICFLSMSLYGLYIARGIGLVGTYIKYAIPICIVICILFAISCWLIGTGIARGMHIPAIISAETAVFFMSIEAIVEYQSESGINLGWSLILMAVLVSFAVICEAIAYATSAKK